MVMLMAVVGLVDRRRGLILITMYLSNLVQTKCKQRVKQFSAVGFGINVGHNDLIRLAELRVSWFWHQINPFSVILPNSLLR